MTRFFYMLLQEHQNETDTKMMMIRLKVALFSWLTCKVPPLPPFFFLLFQFGLWMLQKFRHGNCTPIGIYTHQLSSQHAPRYIQYAPMLWVKKKILIRNCSCASFRFGRGRLVHVVSVKWASSESTLFLGMHNAVLEQPLWFLQSI